MKVIVRIRARDIDDTNEYVHPSNSFELAILDCCQSLMKNALTETSITKHYLNINNGDKPVGWQCPQCGKIISLSVGE